MILMNIILNSLLESVLSFNKWGNKGEQLLGCACKSQYFIFCQQSTQIIQYKLVTEKPALHHT